MSDRYFEIDPELNDRQMEALEKAEWYAENRSRSHSGTGVGAAITTGNGKIFGGANMGMVISQTRHAEETALYNALTDEDEKFNYTDFRDLVIYFDAGSSERGTSICNQCQAYVLEFTHPKLNIIQADSEGAKYLTRLEELGVKVPGMDQDEWGIWPSTEYIPEHTNSEPLLPLDDELFEFYEEEGSQFRKLCEELDLEIVD